MANANIKTPSTKPSPIPSNTTELSSDELIIDLGRASVSFLTNAFTVGTVLLDDSHNTCEAFKSATAPSTKVFCASLIRSMLAVAQEKMAAKDDSHKRHFSGSTLDSNHDEQANDELAAMKPTVEENRQTDILSIDNKLAAKQKLTFREVAIKKQQLAEREAALIERQGKVEAREIMVMKREAKLATRVKERAAKGAKAGKEVEMEWSFLKYTLDGKYWGGEEEEEKEASAM